MLYFAGSSKYGAESMAVSVGSGRTGSTEKNE